MLKRPDSTPGSSWMRRLNDSVPSPGPDAAQGARYRRWYILFWTIWLALMFLGHGVTRAVARAPLQPYESQTRIAGLPLLAYGEQPRGIIAIGAFPVGVVALGGVAVGVIAFGGLAAGGIAIGGVSLGVLALAGMATGIWAVGGGSFGYYAFGGLAVGAYAYSGNGVALGYYEAHGRQKEKLLG